MYALPTVTGTVNRYPVRYEKERSKLPVLFSKANEGYKGAPSPSPKLVEEISELQITNENLSNNSVNVNSKNAVMNNVNYEHFYNKGIENWSKIDNNKINIINNKNFSNTAIEQVEIRNQKDSETPSLQHQEINRWPLNSVNNGKIASISSESRNKCVSTSKEMLQEKEKQLQQRQQQQQQLFKPIISQDRSSCNNTAPHISYSTTAPNAPVKTNAPSLVRNYAVVSDEKVDNNYQRDNDSISTTLPRLPIQNGATHHNNNNNVNYDNRSTKPISTVRAVDRGPQPMCVTPTRLPDGRRVITEQRRVSLFSRKSVTILDNSNNNNNNNMATKKNNNNNNKKQEFVSDTSQPELKPLPGRRPRRNLTNRKQIKLTIGNDNSWMKGLTESTWITSPVESKPLSIPYKRVPNKKRSQQRRKENGARTSCNDRRSNSNSRRNRRGDNKQTFWQRLRDMFN